MFSCFSKGGRFARTRQPLSRTRIHHKFQAPKSSRFAWTNRLFVGSLEYNFETMLSSRGSACQAPPRRLPEAIRVAAATRTGFSSSDGNSEFEYARKRVFGVGQTTISALAVFKCLERERFVRTRRHFTKKVRFVTALVITGRRPRPGIAKTKRIWPQSGQHLFGFPE